MSVLDDFVRMRLYRERASEFELLADAEVSPNVQSRYRIVARHYRELATARSKPIKPEWPNSLSELFNVNRQHQKQTCRRQVTRSPS